MIRLIGYFFGIGTVLLLIAAGAVAWYVGSITRDLPDYEVLNSYEPPVTTRVHASDGQLMAEYAAQRRLYLPIQAIPDRVKAAFISAEDKNFYTHPGVDPVGLARAIVTNVQNIGSGRRPVGASTITQQVAKNFLLSSDQTISRKAREAILSFRIEQAYSKDRILELYLNEIFFGLNSYGIAGAALTYFNKSVNELTIAETAYLAALPKAPSNYHPFRNTERAVERRNWVIDRMVDNGYVTPAEAEEAKAQPLGVTPRRTGSYLFASEYFAEEVRRELLDRYGKTALYEGGLSVRTTLDPELQRLARKSLQKGLINFDERRGFRGPVATIDVAGDWGAAIGEIDPLRDVPEWKLAVVLSADAEEVQIGLRPEAQVSGATGEERQTAVIRPADMQWAFRLNIGDERKTVKTPDQVLSPGDVIYVEQRKDDEGTPRWRLRQPPEVQGALVAMDPHTGRVLAMVGGFSFAQSEFNRATQAMRQPGSAFKPFVYAAALDNGYTPASVILDAPIEIVSGGEVWRPKNYGGGSAGPSTLRLGIERSRNLMTVRLAKDMGMNLVAEYSERFGVYDDMLPVLAMSLGSGETTVMRMVSAYSVLANGGKQIRPSLVDRIQDRYGKTIFRHEERRCDACVATAWLNQPEPEVIDEREQVLDPMTSYQITSMMEGVVQRGTAAGKVTLDRPTAGKTGTTNDEKDAWFVGYTPNLVTAVFIGYDTPTPMGRGATGGALAAPVFNEFMQAAVEGTRPSDFRVPEGMKLIAINRKTGMEAPQGADGTIMEAFKPGTGPSDFYSVIGMDQVATGEAITEVSPQASQAVSSGAGGLY
ncbi:penicillin-binding protein 1A [Pseudohoeflea coraliihabitans]|uniref:Penicillin-binding protein 1A n=1 Tax=Pseudohoeflea coraliihabitans TaxID=2860393 RepID=A0ABS6WSK6_9HYPH|nr:penicillin-binding protein 1A [Pseudohoeflea sp. DP4N28-3]MBW3098944.1 penicillin-binding protein 1A [Pseudohoeflea sp. DP4N28-3]